MHPKLTTQTVFKRYSFYRVHIQVNNNNKRVFNSKILQSITCAAIMRNTEVNCVPNLLPVFFILKPALMLKLLHDAIFQVSAVSCQNEYSHYFLSIYCRVEATPFSGIHLLPSLGSVSSTQFPVILLLTFCQSSDWYKTLVSAKRAWCPFSQQYWAIADFSVCLAEHDICV